ncbi:pectinesterase inhibitor-like [Benincasa hispida]|uniref:pectinesterase inhibitor-like n=1 Tax=Benincasa hispida TaxID=102211 RepID=UPI001901E9E4|nr:pectinesterase inhibitor-like [Benincasa hispida]
MAEKHLVSFSFVFLAVAVFAGQAHGSTICDKSDYPALCRSAVKGASDPESALKAAIEHLISETNHAKESSQTVGNLKSLSVCKQNFKDAVDDLQKSLQHLKNYDLPSLKISLSGALTDYSTCDDAVVDNGDEKKALGVLSTDALLERLASNCLYLASLLRLK